MSAVLCSRRNWNFGDWTQTRWNLVAGWLTLHTGVFTYSKIDKIHTTFRETQETLALIESLDLDADESPNEEAIAKKFGWEEEYSAGQLTFWHRLKPKLWSLFDEPWTSPLARAISAISISFIVLSILCFCLKTSPEMRLPSIHVQHQQPLKWFGENLRKYVKIFHDRNTMENTTQYEGLSFEDIQFIQLGEAQSNTRLVCGVGWTIFALPTFAPQMDLSSSVI